MSLIQKKCNALWTSSQLAANDYRSYFLDHRLRKLSLIFSLNKEKEKHIFIEITILSSSSPSNVFLHQCGYTTAQLAYTRLRYLCSRLFVLHTIYYTQQTPDITSYRRAPNFITGSVLSLYAKCVTVPDHAFDACSENLFTWTVDDSVVVVQYNSRVTMMSKHLRML